MKNNRGDVLAVVGAQYGSEGKGVIVNHIANKYDVHVRTGGPNAGHSFFHKGQKEVMQTIPCGWTNPNAFLVIGAGGMIEPSTLVKEIDHLLEIDPTLLDRLIIDASAMVIMPWHTEEEGGVHGEMHQRIGSTGKGVGACRRDRLMRNPERSYTVERYAREIGLGTGEWDLTQVIAKDTFRMLNDQINAGNSVLLEGTQGSGLSLIHGPWPYVTSGDTNAAQLCADAGISPLLMTQVMLVARTYPIRVAGNSGPLHDEITWDDISAQVGRPTEEKTTVTKKVRRVGRWDEQLLMRTVALNQPTSIAISFMDYMFPEDEGKTDFAKMSSGAHGFVEYVSTLTRTPVALLGTGGPTWSVASRLDTY